MAKNPDLLQKTYYLHKELDKDIIEFIANCRNSSELIRNLLIKEMRIQNGEIALIDIKNRQIIGEINIPSPTSLNNASANNEIENNKDNNEESVANKDMIMDFLSTCKYN